MTETTTPAAAETAPKLTPEQALAQAVRDYAGVKSRETLFDQALNQLLALGQALQLGTLENGRAALADAYLAFSANTALPSNSAQPMSVFGMFQQQQVNGVQHAIVTLVSALTASHGVTGADAASARDAFNTIAQALGTTMDEVIAYI